MPARNKLGNVIRRALQIDTDVKKALLALAVVLGGTAMAWARHGSDPPHVSSHNIWPGRGITVLAPPYRFPASFGTKRVYLDPGHGAEGNAGNTSSLCKLEQDFTLALALHVAEWLEETHHFEVKLSRDPGKLVDYPSRVSDAEAWGAEVFISLHSDVRGENVHAEGECPLSRIAPGFSVLWSDDADEPLKSKRVALARSTSRQMQRMGVLAYAGEDYVGLYGGDTMPGVFVDRHASSERIFVLHKPSMPSIIIETHNAWDDREAARWNKKETRDVFSAALAAALIHALR
jgi:N-acetylmuramoyl-L-alanine amidase